MPRKTPDAPAASTPDEVDPRVVAELRGRMLDWFRVHQRDLPWRSESPDPYAVLVSEAMLQQTQVATVLDYFRRFMERFPTTRTLAEADEQEVLRLWQGLGYYRRARSLHAAAKAIVEKHGGEVPQDLDAIAELPGVGRYTAGAVASIAFGLRAPILDGNVARVLARWFAIREPIDSSATRARLWRLAETMVPHEDAGDFNQSMMELGALVCVPRNPRCLVCPVASLCQAFAKAITDEVPARLPRRAPTAVQHHVVAVARGSELLFEQRPATGLWAGMWQLPTAEDLSSRVGPKRIQAWAEQRLGIAIGPPKRAGEFDYATTHRSIAVVVWTAEAVSGRAKGGRWRKLSETEDLPVSNLQKRALKMLMK